MHSSKLNRARWFVLPALAAALLTSSLSAQAAIAVGVSINLAPPELPVYEQPEIPGPNYIWAPGYWAYGDDGYFWVPGTWVEAPQPGYLWTPGYWGFVNGGYFFHEGYWGPHVGFYGGVNYGYGYGGSGYEGGYWNHGAFFYNRSVNHIGPGVHITNVYNKTVINNVNVTRVSYNGGSGIAARPTPQEAQVAHERHVAPTPTQIEHVHSAAADPSFQAKVNHGMPAVGATPRPVRSVGARDEQRGGVKPQSPAAAAQAAGASPAARAAQQTHNDRPLAAQQTHNDRPPAASQLHADRPAAATQPAHTDRPPRAQQPQREEQQRAPQQHAAQPPRVETPRAAAEAPHAQAPRAEAPHAQAPHPAAERRAPAEHREPQAQKRPEERRPEDNQH